jgi:hypothetical protein
MKPNCVLEKTEYGVQFLLSLTALHEVMAGNMKLYLYIYRVGQNLLDILCEILWKYTKPLLVTRKPFKFQTSLITWQCKMVVMVNIFHRATEGSL